MGLHGVKAVIMTITALLFLFFISHALPTLSRQSATAYDIISRIDNEKLKAVEAAPKDGHELAVSFGPYAIYSRIE